MQLWYKPICFFLALVEVHTTSANLHSKGISHADFADKKINGLSIGSFHVKTRTACIILCISTPSCLSCATNGDTGQCLLYDKDFIDVRDTTIVSEVSWMYHFVIRLYERYPDRTGCYQYPGSIDKPCDLYCFDYVNYHRPITHDAAEAQCASKNGELVKVDRDLKRYCVENLLGSVTQNAVFIQGAKTNGVWRYNDGSEITYFKWDISNGQPNIHEDVIVIEPYYDFLWHDYSSSDLLNEFVCDLY